MIVTDVAAAVVTIGAEGAAKNGSTLPNEVPELLEAIAQK
jgi:hypothetical protein